MKESASIISIDPLADDAAGSGCEAAEIETRAFQVEPAQHGQRLDRVLAASVPEFSRSYLQQLIVAGAVRLGDTVAAKTAQRLRAGDQGTIELRPTQQSQAFRAEPIALRILYEDAHLRVLDKPAGLVVHPAPGNWSGTLLNGLLALDPANAGVLPRAGIVHRLDKDTSGLMVTARTRVAMDALVRAIAAREVRREYFALAHHRWSGAVEQLIEAAIGRDPRNRLRMAVLDPMRQPAKPAATEVRLMRNSAQACLLHCTLRTGRTHQIRVHLASIGHPLLADPLYGGALLYSLARQALHAARLAFSHPVTGAPLSFEAPLPADLQATLDRMDWTEVTD